MTKDSSEKRNFLFFLNEAHPLSIEDSLIGALASPSSWDAVAGMVNTARQKDAFVRSIKRVQLSGAGPTRRAAVTLVVQMVDQASGEIIYGPDILSRGFVFEDESQEYLNEAKKLVLDTLAGLNTVAHDYFIKIYGFQRLVIIIIFFVDFCLIKISKGLGPIRLEIIGNCRAKTAALDGLFNHDSAQFDNLNAF